MGKLAIIELQDITEELMAACLNCGRDLSEFEVAAW